MCSTEVVVATVTSAAAGAAVGGPVGAVVGGGIGLSTSAGAEGRGPLRGLQVKQEKVKPLPDPKLKETQEKARVLRKRLLPSTGGRKSTIFSQPTGTGPSNLKTKTGQ